MSCAVTVVFAFSAQQKAVQSLVLAHCMNTIEPASKHLVHITLMADVENESVRRSVEHTMQRNRQLHHPQVRPEMPAGFRERLNQNVAHLLGELRQILLPQSFHVRRRTD